VDWLGLGGGGGFVRVFCLVVGGWGVVSVSCCHLGRLVRGGWLVLEGGGWGACGWRVRSCWFVVVCVVFAVGGWFWVVGGGLGVGGAVGAGLVCGGGCGVGGVWRGGWAVGSGGCGVWLAGLVGEVVVVLVGWFAGVGWGLRSFGVR